MSMKKYRIVGTNLDADGNSRTIRSCYGKCGFDSMFRSTGHGITGVVLIYENK